MMNEEGEAHSVLIDDFTRVLIISRAFAGLSTRDGLSAQERRGSQQFPHNLRA